MVTLSRWRIWTSILWIFIPSDSTIEKFLLIYISHLLLIDPPAVSYNSSMWAERNVFPGWFMRNWVCFILFSFWLKASIIHNSNSTAVWKIGVFNKNWLTIYSIFAYRKRGEGKNQFPWNHLNRPLWYLHEIK